MSEQNNTDRTVRYNQIHVELFTRLRTAQNGWLSEVAFDFLKCLPVFIRPSDHAYPSEHEEEMPQFVCEMGYETP